MRNIRSLLTLISFLFVLSSCQSRPVIEYELNKSEELKTYESESEEEESHERMLEEKERLLRESEEEESLAREREAEEKRWKKVIPDKTAVTARGVYIPKGCLNDGYISDFLENIKGTEINAAVIDMLDDEGKTSFPVNDDDLKSLQPQDGVENIEDYIERLKDSGIYLIARIVTFRDPNLKDKKPEWLNHTSDGEVFTDRSGFSWIDPYNRDAWEYKVKVAEECVDLGFDEIQFDYVRFCTEKGMEDCIYPEDETEGLGKTEIISEFIKFAQNRLGARNVFMSADVFGSIIGSYADMESVGQDYRELAGFVDYMCPMIYPSHYSNGNFGLSVPDKYPYETILGAMSISEKALMDDEEGDGNGGSEETGGDAENADFPENGNAAVSGKDGEISKANVRPWLQGFTASYLPEYITYGKDEIRKEIQAVMDSGGQEWLIWNASGSYDFEIFKDLE